MIEGKIEIYLSHKEPVFKENILWLRPYLDKEGYELLYYGANGWTLLNLSIKNKCKEDKLVIKDSLCTDK